MPHLFVEGEVKMAQSCWSYISAEGDLWNPGCLSTELEVIVKRDFL